LRCLHYQRRGKWYSQPHRASLGLLYFLLLTLDLQKTFAGIVRRLIVSELSQLSPQPLWDIFAKICSIPHPSYHEEQLAEHIMGWAKEKAYTLNAIRLATF
jgi:hypothetical protein